MKTDRRALPRAVLRELRRSFPASDLSLWAAGATFFGMIGIVPLAMVGLRLTALLIGPADVVHGMEAFIGGLPPGHGTATALRTLTDTALDLSWWRTAVLLFPAGLYGEGLRRAFLQESPQEGNALTGWIGRLGMLPVAAVTPFLLAALLESAPWVGPLYAGGGSGLLLGIVVGFHIDWVLVSLTVLLAYEVVAAGRIGWRALVVGAFSVGAVLDGFLHGFLLFLAIPIEWSLPFGGLPVVGAAAALGLWLYLLHVLLLVGYRLTLGLDATVGAARDRTGAPQRP